MSEKLMRTREWIMAAGISLLAVAATTAPGLAQTAAPNAGNSMQTGTSESLSSKLNKSDGVITPNTSVDPGIKVPAPVPQPNSTPVIPPSATGGNSAK